ncbi:MAG: D-alanyl-D-alanine carboxypeptidase, partial [Bacteroidales bacterium]|nr:D-alanyl-D-alanine carboxypeptidase [Bacteroidales bacterium]
MKLIATILFTLLSLGAGAAGGSSADGKVQKSVEALDAKGGMLEHSVWGVLAVNFAGDTLADLNRGKCMVPASNMKLVTTAAAYLKLGRNYRFET